MRLATQRPRQASALISVLAVLVILAISVVALASAMRIERMSAHYAMERARAEFLAAGAVEELRAILSTATAAGNRWISMPGRIVFSDSRLADDAVTVVDLFSGLPLSGGSPDDILNGWDINRPTLSGDGVRNIDPNSSEMSVGWIYFRKDGSTDPEQSPNTSDTMNPIIGRIAFWVDDESSRINLNTAWKRENNDTDANSPSKINLLALAHNFTEQHANTIRAEAERFPFSSPDDVHRTGNDLSDILSQMRFSTTFRSSSPDLNPWGESKIVLTTRKTLAGDRPFLDILKAEGADPGLLINLSGSKVQETLNDIVRLLSRSDWPSGNGSFVDKYGERNAQQLAIDILEYVRSVESPQAIVEGMRVLPTGTLTYDFQNITNPNTFFGSVRRPLLTEVGVWFSAPNAAGNCDVVWKFEVYFPGGLGLTDEERNLVGKKIECTTLRRNPDGSWGAAVPSGSINAANQTIGASLGSYEIVPRGDDVFGVITVRRNNQSVGGSRPDGLFLRPVLNAEDTAGDFNRVIWDVAPITSERNDWIQYQVDPVGVPEEAMTTVQVADPRVNKVHTDWKQGPATFGNFNFEWKKQATAFPPQDTDQSGAVSDAGLKFPPPAGRVGNLNGRVVSVGELGYIATGIASSVPWRSLRLQPAATNDELPDWLLMDLFTSPVLDEEGKPYPPEQPAPGKINVNAQIHPFESISRITPLESLLLNAPGIPPASVPTLAENIRTRTYAKASAQYERLTEGFVSVGEIAEISGISDRGEESEDTLREIIDLASIRGNVFRVHAIGQSLKQTPSGTLLIQSEKSVVAILERTTDGKIRIVHWKIFPL